MRWRLRRRVTAAGAALAVLAITGCSEEQTFSAEEFVDEVKAGGVELHLGKPLFSEDEGKEVYDVELEPVHGAEPPSEPGEHGEGNAHGGGSLTVHDQVGDADAALESCRAAADLLCYQAANVVVVLQAGGIEAQRLAVAMERLAEE
jgi:hypothetical protein